MSVEDHKRTQDRADAVQLIKIARRKLTSEVDEIAAIYLDHSLSDLQERGRKSVARPGRPLNAAE